MKLPVVYSLKPIEHQYRTGEEPVLVVCSDKHSYICKYMRSASAAYKLASELLGSALARHWSINSPEVAIVNIKPNHWSGLFTSHITTAPAFGARRVSGVIDVTSSTTTKVSNTEHLLRQLACIALFDFWVANEDRNINNANLMYDISKEIFVPINYGCIFNTATFDYPLSQLTSTDSILFSDLFSYLISNRVGKCDRLVNDLKQHFTESIMLCNSNISSVISQIPDTWNLPKELIIKKTNELFEEKWLKDVWQNFVECFYESLTR